jgi:hypothetical protein
MTQLSLNLTRREGKTLDSLFADFHGANPRVYAALVRLAREAKARGRKRLGIGMLFERVRWDLAMETAGDEFKVNNSFRSRYARLIAKQEPDLADFFEFRELKT